MWVCPPGYTGTLCQVSISFIACVCVFVFVCVCVCVCVCDLPLADQLTDAENELGKFEIPSGLIWIHNLVKSSH